MRNFRDRFPVGLAVALLFSSLACQTAPRQPEPLGLVGPRDFLNQMRKAGLDPKSSPDLLSKLTSGPFFGAEILKLSFQEKTPPELRNFIRTELQNYQRSAFLARFGSQAGGDFRSLDRKTQARMIAQAQATPWNELTKAQITALHAANGDPDIPFGNPVVLYDVTDGSPGPSPTGESPHPTPTGVLPHPTLTGQTPHPTPTGETPHPTPTGSEPAPSPSSSPGPGSGPHESSISAGPSPHPMPSVNPPPPPGKRTGELTDPQAEEYVQKHVEFTDGCTTFSILNEDPPVCGPWEFRDTERLLYPGTPWEKVGPERPCPEDALLGWLGIFRGNGPGGPPPNGKPARGSLRITGRVCQDWRAKIYETGLMCRDCTVRIFEEDELCDGKPPLRYWRTYPLPTQCDENPVSHAGYITVTTTGLDFRPTGSYFPPPEPEPIR